MKVNERVTPLSTKVNWPFDGSVILIQAQCGFSGVRSAACGGVGKMSVAENARFWDRL